MLASGYRLCCRNICSLDFFWGGGDQTNTSTFTGDGGDLQHWDWGGAGHARVVLQVALRACRAAALVVAAAHSLQEIQSKVSTTFPG